MKLKIFGLILLLISTYVIGCSQKIVRGDEPPKPIITVVSDEKTEVPVVLGSYSWKSEIDKIGPSELLKGHKPVILSSNSELEIKFDYKPNPSGLIIRKRNTDTGEVILEEKLKNNLFTTSSEVGMHIYEIDAEWRKNRQQVEAQATYYFQIQVIK